MSSALAKPSQTPAPQGDSRRAMISLAVIAALFAPFGATYLWLPVQKALVKKEVRARLIQGIDKSELAQLTFSKSQAIAELRWENDEEFEYQGEMHDVVETQTLGDSIRYACWKDDAETELNKRLQTLIAQATSGSPEHRAREALCYQLLKSLAATFVSPVIFITSESKRLFVSKPVHLDSIALQNAKKPPRFKFAI